MSNVLDKLNDSQRKNAAKAARRAREDPAAVVLAELLIDVVRANVLHRIGRRVGIPLRRRDWFVLVSYFGQRTPAYEMVWQVRQPSLTEALGDEFSKAVIAALRKNARGETAGKNPQASKIQHGTAPSREESPERRQRHGW